MFWSCLYFLLIIPIHTIQTNISESSRKSGIKDKFVLMQKNPLPNYFIIISVNSWLPKSVCNSPFKLYIPVKRLVPKMLKVFPPLLTLTLKTQDSSFPNGSVSLSPGWCLPCVHAVLEVGYASIILTGLALCGLKDLVCLCKTLPYTYFVYSVSAWC